MTLSGKLPKRSKQYVLTFSSRLLPVIGSLHYAS
jgi:hypothetical protein